MILDFSKCQTVKDVERVAAKARDIAQSRRRVLVGFAHFDLGQKQEGCDCCYCAPPRGHAMTPPTIPPSVRERPILMTGDSVRGILEGRKKQTRRVVKPQPAGAWAAPGKTACPYGHPGDRLWVREPFRAEFIETEARYRFRYSADDSCRWDCDEMPAEWTEGRDWLEPWPDVQATKWFPSIHMPRWASRLTLEITEVRVQRVQEITPDDAMAEGALLEEDGWHNPDIWFQDAWDRLNAKRGFSWESNPWVWAITFKVVPHD